MTGTGTGRDAANRVPDPTTSFWVIKLLTTGMGEALSDFLVTRLDPVPTVLVTAVLLVIVLAVQLTATHYRPWTYWSAVSLVSVVGTMVADVAHVALGVPYLVSTLVFLTALIAVFTLWRRTERTLDVHDVTTRRRQSFYWAGIITTFALGTAAGDLLATTFHLGYLMAGVVFIAAMVLVIAGRVVRAIGPITAFWVAYVLTRPIGASLADWFAVPSERGGLAVGTGLVSAVLLVAIVSVVSASTGRRRAPTPSAPTPR